MNQIEFQSKTSVYRRARNYDPLKVSWHLLYDIDTKRPIACSKKSGTINGLAQRYPNTTQWFNVHSTPNMFGNIKVASDFKQASCWEWKFNLKTREFDHAPDNSSLDNLYKSMVIVEKAAILDRLIIGVNSFRRSFQRDLIDQQYVYDLKVAEATEIIKLGHTAIDENAFPFVSDYARSVGCNLKVAAMDILQHNAFHREALRKSEAFRLKYANAIYGASELIELKAIVSDIDKELAPYVKI